MSSPISGVRVRIYKDMCHVCLIVSKKKFTMDTTIILK